MIWAEANKREMSKIKREQAGLDLGVNRKHMNI